MSCEGDWLWFCDLQLFDLLAPGTIRVLENKSHRLWEWIGTSRWGFELWRNTRYGYSNYRESPIFLEVQNKRIKFYVLKFSRKLIVLSPRNSYFELYFKMVVSLLSLPQRKWCLSPSMVDYNEVSMKIKFELAQNGL